MLSRETMKNLYQCWVQGQSDSMISRNLGVSRTTVRKYREIFSNELVKRKGDRINPDQIINNITYDTSKRKSKVTQEIRDRVLELMSNEDWEKHSKDGNGNVITIYFQINREFVVRGGIGYSTICNLVREIEDEYDFSPAPEDF